MARNFRVLKVYRGPLISAAFCEWLAIYFHHSVTKPIAVLDRIW